MVELVRAGRNPAGVEPGLAQQFEGVPAEELRDPIAREIRACVEREVTEANLDEERRAATP